jgi:hypothetical protein
MRRLATSRDRAPHPNRSAAGATGAGVRRGAVGSLDYVLALGVILPIVAIVLPLAQRIIQLVYEMTLVLVSWPFS